MYTNVIIHHALFIWYGGGELTTEGVELKPGQYLKIWCEEHNCFHKMSYDYLLSLVPAESHSKRGF